MSNACTSLISHYIGILDIAGEQLTIKVDVYDQSGKLVPETTPHRL